LLTFSELLPLTPEGGTTNLPIAAGTVRHRIRPILPRFGPACIPFRFIAIIELPDPEPE
jgi:hypothetical protein